jgi:hypothetical protein
MDLDWVEPIMEKLFWPVLALIGLWWVFDLLRGRKRHLAEQKAQAEDAEKAEAMFKSMFPELQPHFHPSRVVEHVQARVRRGPVGGTWEDPPGFPAAKRAVIEDTPKGERTVLEDASGAYLAEFLYLEGDRPDVLGLLRIGPAKYRVTLGDRASYWHPHREFKWKGPGRWTFTSRVADDSIDSDDRGTSWSDTSSSSTSSMRTAALAGGAAGVAGAAAAAESGGDASDTSY